MFPCFARIILSVISWLFDTSGLVKPKNKSGSKLGRVLTQEIAGQSSLGFARCLGRKKKRPEKEGGGVKGERFSFLKRDKNRRGGINRLVSVTCIKTSELIIF